MSEAAGNSGSSPKRDSKLSVDIELAASEVLARHAAETASDETLRALAGAASAVQRGEGEASDVFARAGVVAAKGGAGKLASVAGLHQVLVDAVRTCTFTAETLLALLALANAAEPGEPTRVLLQEHAIEACLGALTADGAPECVRRAAVSAVRNVYATADERSVSEDVLCDTVRRLFTHAIATDDPRLLCDACAALRLALRKQRCEPACNPFERHVDALLPHCIVNRYARLPDGRTLWVQIEANRLLCALCDVSVAAPLILARKEFVRALIEFGRKARQSVLAEEAVQGLGKLAAHARARASGACPSDAASESTDAPAEYSIATAVSSDDAFSAMCECVARAVAGAHSGATLVGAGALLAAIGCDRLRTAAGRPHGIALHTALRRAVEQCAEGTLDEEVRDALCQGIASLAVAT